MARDLEYEQLNIIYCNTNDTNAIKCKNYDLCQNSLQLDHYDCHGNYLCMTCGDWFKQAGFGWNELEFRISEE